MTSAVGLCLRSCLYFTLTNWAWPETMKPLQHLYKKPGKKFVTSSCISWILSKLPAELLLNSCELKDIWVNVGVQVICSHELLPVVCCACLSKFNSNYPGKSASHYTWLIYMRILSVDTRHHWWILNVMQVMSASFLISCNLLFLSSYSLLCYVCHTNNRDDLWAEPNHSLFLQWSNTALIVMFHVVSCGHSGSSSILYTEVYVSVLQDMLKMFLVSLDTVLTPFKQILVLAHCSCSLDLRDCKALFVFLNTSSMCGLVQ
jgi:hypothetical protein